MIVKMSKYAFLIYHQEYDDFLKTLRELGVLHIVEKHPSGNNEEMQRLLSLRKRMNGLLRILKRLNDSSKAILAPSREVSMSEGAALLDEIQNLQEKKTSVSARVQQLEKEISEMSIWGDFSYDELNRLKEAGYAVTFFSCPASKFDDQWLDDYNGVIINTFQSVVYFITITAEDEIPEIEAERPKMSETGLSQLKSRLESVQNELEEIRQQIISHAAADYQTLIYFDKLLQNEFNYSNAIHQADSQAGDKLLMLEGWIPTDQVPEMTAALEKDGYFFQELEIAEEDNVPIKLKNNKFSRLFEPITELFSLPNYHEFDPTPFFAPFFMMFFGFCFGDAGYGILILVACTILKKKVKAGFRPYLTLFQYLGVATIVFGTLTGSFFGISLAEVPALVKFKHYFLNNDNLMALAIVVGLLQIIFGKCVAVANTIQQKGWKHGVAPIGWVLIIVAGLAIFGLPMMGFKLPEIMITVLYGFVAIGLILAMLFNTPGKNVFLNVGTGLWNAYNMASGLLGDTLSYIRLFAIGLTGAILGGVFNDLAFTLSDGWHIIPRALFILVILLIGHSINFGLCMISSLVHPLRLTFVEYYKNAEFAGGGKAYKPFKKEVIEK